MRAIQVAKYSYSTPASFAIEALRFIAVAISSALLLLHHTKMALTSDAGAQEFLPVSAT